MKKILGKIFIGIGITIVAVPLLFIALFITIELFGYAANHVATSKQTKKLTEYVEKSIEDANITDTYSFTGNISGTGNYVECMSQITFESDISEDTLESIFEEQYKYYELEVNNNNCMVTVYGDAPFPDNIEGH
ncbi:MAG: hypothetical protein K6B41_08560 [Butyrivibrio sp.]|nr:hypothetical protein [Butyrivibrio sp.]